MWSLGMGCGDVLQKDQTWKEHGKDSGFETSLEIMLCKWCRLWLQFFGLHIISTHIEWWMAQPTDSQ